METFRPKKSPLSDRFLSSFSPSADAGGELEETDVFWISTDYSRSGVSSPSSSIPTVSPVRSKAFGILAALGDDDRKEKVRTPGVLQRKASISSSSSSTSTSPTSSARMIPVAPKPKGEFGLGRIQQQSAPVNVPVMRRSRIGFKEVENGDDDDDEEEMLPPHEIVARASGKDSPLTTFSVLEGAGRTLKGRDLRRVRNAVWRQTGFLD